MVVVLQKVGDLLLDVGGCSISPPRSATCGSSWILLPLFKPTSNPSANPLVFFFYHPNNISSQSCSGVLFRGPQQKAKPWRGSNMCQSHLPVPYGPPPTPTPHPRSSGPQTLAFSNTPGCKLLDTESSVSQVSTLWNSLSLTLLQSAPSTPSWGTTCSLRPTTSANSVNPPSIQPTLSSAQPSLQLLDKILK